MTIERSPYLHVLSIRCYNIVLTLQHRFNVTTSIQRLFNAMCRLAYYDLNTTTVIILSINQPEKTIFLTAEPFLKKSLFHQCKIRLWNATPSDWLNLNASLVYQFVANSILFLIFRGVFHDFVCGWRYRLVLPNIGLTVKGLNVIQFKIGTKRFVTPSTVK